RRRRARWRTRPSSCPAARTSSSCSALRTSAPAAASSAPTMATGSKAMTRTFLAPACAIAAPALAAPGRPQQTATEEPSRGRAGRRVSIDPYIEASQVLVAELSPGDDTVTYTQLAAGVDASVTGRNNGGAVSLRYERNIGYGDETLDSDTLSGVARGYATIV